MTDNDALHVPARTIPVPTSVSEAARAVLAAGPFAAEDYPAADDLDGWRTLAEASNGMIAAMFGARLADFAADVEETAVEGVPVYVITPADVRPAAEGRAYLDVHGGALHLGAGVACRAMGTDAARRTGLATWSVDYRMPPDHPYPAALDDCLAVYRALLERYDATDIVVGGQSAGGNIAAALLLRARDEGLPLPGAAVLVTPEVDLTESGDSFRTNLGVDTLLLRSLMPANLLYAGGHDLTDPYLSPLFGDFAKGFPPTFLQTGTRDLFLSNAVRMHRALRAAGVPAELHVFEAMPHGGFFGAPEDAEIDAEVQRFVDAHRR
ncbi:MAG: alpha/beta hydrolase [Acidimicrobiia bacterium]|jgi:acetyl esterase/lipase